MTDSHQMLTIEDGAKVQSQYKILLVYPKLKSYVLKNRKILEIKELHTSENKILVKSKVEGFITKQVKVGNIVQVGDNLITVEDCQHPTIMRSLCCDCGTVLLSDTTDMNMASTKEHVSMLHSIPDLKVSRKEAERLGAEDISNLLKCRRLVLLVDLDQTLIHTTNDNIPPKLKDVYHFQFATNGPWYHTRLRPFAKEFLKKMSQLYELHICTFGVREYAHSIAKFLDPKTHLFGNRILSRNECLNSLSKKANLNSLFPCGDNLVCIIDDRSDVWNFAPNVVQVLPYHFFKHTGDINAPPGLQKKENDEKKGFDFEQLEANLRKNEKNDSKSDVIDVDLLPIDKNCTNKSDSKVEDMKEESNTSSTAKIDDSDKVISTTKTSIGGEAEIHDKIEVAEKNENCQKIDGDESTNKDDVTLTEPGESSEDKDSHHDEEVKKIEEIKTDESVSDSSKDAFVQVTDDDDYLLFLEDILKKLHSRFYKLYDECRDPLPDLKRIVPSMREEVLNGVNIVFSGVIPNHVSLHNSKAYHVAKSLGARVTVKFLRKSHQFPTTHLIATSLHTEKSKQARKMGLIIINPNWLWCCAERWEWVEEKLFKVADNNFERIPPLHCLLPKGAESNPSTSSEEENISENVNSPVYYLSDTDTKDMMAEVDDCLSDDSDKEEDASSESSITPYESSEESEPLEPENPNKEIELSRKRKRYQDEDTADSEDDQLPSVIFGQGDVPSDLSDDSENEFDEDFNAYGDILERQMLDKT